MRDSFGRFVKGHVVLDKWKDSFREKGLGKARHTTSHTEESKNKISLSRKGKAIGIENGNWNGGISSISTRHRGSSEYKKWRQDVFKRDNFKCRKCEIVGEYLHVHHITPFSEKMDNYDINNGLTVCYKCHEKIHGKRLGKGSYIRK